MNRSVKTQIKCFVPWCKNTTTNRRDIIFLNIRDSMKRKWSRQLNLKYKPGCTSLCCQDHFILEEDLENFHKWRLMENTRPRLKSNAKLRISHSSFLTNQEKTRDTKSEITSNKSSSLLKQLLLEPIENSWTTSTSNNIVFIKSENV